MSQVIPSEEKATSYRPLLKQVAERESSRKKYQELFIGSTSLVDLARYELTISTLQSFPGALGIVLRRRIYPILFRRCGRNVLFGRNVTLRVTRRIELGNHVIVDDNTVLDAKGDPELSFIRCGNDVEISRNSILACKASGSITIGNFVSIGRNVLLSAIAPITIGDNCSIGPYTAILASGHDWSDPDTPVLLQGRSIGNITIEDNVWIGAHVTIMDGVTIGANSVVSANSVVTHDLPPYSVAAGQPARVVSYRKDVSQESQPDDAADGVQKRDNGAGVQKEPLRESDTDMARSTKVDESAILAVIYKAIDELNQQRPKEMQLEKTPDTLLFTGPADNSGSLDSLGLLNLVVLTEQKLEEELDLVVSLADDAVKPGQNPFRTTGILAAHIRTVMSGADDDG